MKPVGTIWINKGILITILGSVVLLIILLVYLWLGVNHNKASIQYICNQTLNYSPVLGNSEPPASFCK